MWTDDAQRELFAGHLEKVEKDLCQPILREKQRFPTVDRLMGRYNESRTRFVADGLPALSQFFEMQNELCVALAMLEDMSNGSCTNIEYEVPLENCKRRLDFRVKYPSGPVRWLEVKTIHPNRQDDWQKYLRDRDGDRFPDNVEWVIERDWMGGEIYHKAVAVRSKIMDYSLDTESKIESCLDPEEPRITFLAFFSNGFDWHPDELEDFLFFYRTGKHLDGDPFAEMEQHHAETQGIVFKRNIQHFAYLERPDLSVRPLRGTWSVQLPNWPPRKGVHEL